jgi:hypothetical protein
MMRRSEHLSYIDLRDREMIKVKAIETEAGSE